MAVYTFGHVDGPLRPFRHAGVCAISAGCSLSGWVTWFQGGAVIGISGTVIAEPDDVDMAISIGCDPGKYVSVPHGRTLIDADRGCPGIALIGGRGEPDIAVIRPNGVNKSKFIHGKCRENLVGAVGSAQRTQRTGENLVVTESKYRQAQVHVA